MRVKIDSSVRKPGTEPICREFKATCDEHWRDEMTPTKPVSTTIGVRKILVAVDFSPDSDAAFQQAIWLARKSGAAIVLAHTRHDLRHAMHGSSYEARLDFLYGKGDLLQEELRSESNSKLKQLITKAGSHDLNIQFETLVGEPFVQLTHAVQAQGFDIVFVGTRGLSAWKQILVGSTAKKLVRSCPADVWIARSTDADSPKVVLAATDFSDASLKAVKKSLAIAQLAGAEFHLLHVIDAGDIPEGETSTLLRGGPLEAEITTDARRRLEALIESQSQGDTPVQIHLAWGTPWQEIVNTAKALSADLIGLGNVGRTGISGLLLGNTAETVLNHCESSVLTVKPDDYVSPVDPNFWPLLSEPRS